MNRQIVQSGGDTRQVHIGVGFRKPPQYRFGPMESADEHEIRIAQ
jgi:hypothetical protein